MPTAPPLLQRTPLYERHLAAGGKLVEFAGWEMPLHYGAWSPSTWRCATGCGVFDVSHMGQIETSGPQALGLLQRLLTNDVAAIGFDTAGRRPVLAAGRDDGGVLDDLIIYPLARSLPDGHQRRQPRARWEWFQEQARGVRGPRSATLAADFAMLALQGPAGTRRSSPAARQAPLPARMRAAEDMVADVPALRLRHRLHRRARGRDHVPPGTWRGSGMRCPRRGATPAGLVARDTLRTEGYLPLYGNELRRARGPIEAGLGWACKTHGLHRRGCRRAGPPRPAGRSSWWRSSSTGRASLAPGNPVEGGGKVTSGTLSPCLREGIGMAYVPRDAAPPARGCRSTSVARCARPSSGPSRSTERLNPHGRGQLSR